MGCGASRSDTQAPIQRGDVSSEAAQEAAATPAAHKDTSSAATGSQQPKPQAGEQKSACAASTLDNRKWKMLMDWTGWHTKDQFGWEQPQLADIVGPNQRSKLSGKERPYPYQVAISFPGADFDKGSAGHQADLLDHNGKVLATSGTEMGEALQHWLVQDWLDGDEARGLTHVFVCSKNLKYCPGSIKAKNFRHYASAASPTDDSSTAILNENWAMYLRESFLEARVVVFVVNEDWLDSIPCNQEFEALITRKRAFRSEGRDAIIFVDITDDKFNQRWGAKLPQYKEGMAHEASKYFDVHQFTYNAQASAEDKLRVQREFVRVCAQYSAKHPADPGLELQDLTVGAKEVYWPNWLYFRSLDGTNGWEPVVQVSEGEIGFQTMAPAFTPATRQVASRRFRLRVMGITGDTFNEGYKYMCHPIQLIDAATGANIVAEGKGYWRAAGERMNTLGFSHWCGPKQYSWLEWLVPDDQPPVVIKEVDVRVNARHWVVEVMPVDKWPTHGEALKDYTFLGYADTTTANVSTAVKPPKWVPLHQVSEGVPQASTGGEIDLAADAPPCKAFRLRFLGAADGAAPGATVAATVSIKAHFPEGLYPLGGGVVSGTGGDASMEDAVPACAFDGNDQTRWVDVHGGGIGNTAVLAYDHPEAVEVVEYTITSQMYALSSYHSHLNGTPRDWTLQVQPEGQEEWVVVDKRSQVYFTNHRETKKFTVEKPVKAAKHKLVFTAVAAGCASRSIQIGDVELLARMPARTKPLEAQQLVALSSAYLSPDPAAVSPVRHGLAPEYGVQWGAPGQLQLHVPVHPTSPALGAVQGGVLGWTLGEGRVSNWYDHPLEVPMEPKLHPEDPDQAVETKFMLVVRPRKEVIVVDDVHHVSFRKEYPGGEAELVYTHPRPFAAKAYSLYSSGNYERGDPHSWVLEAETETGKWVSIHAVANFNFPDRMAPAMFYMPGNEVQATRYRLVITAMNAMVGLLHLAHFAMYKPLAGEEAADADAVRVPRTEAAHVTLKLRPREAAGGQVKPTAYCVATGQQQQPGSMPTAWVLEGLTSEYAD